MANIFNRYRELARKAEINLGTKESLDWFRKRIRKDSTINDLRTVSENLRNGRIEPGKMFTYVYDPKTKDKMQYYDNFPLVIILEVVKGGWYGANLHYLPPSMRVNLLEELSYRRNNVLRIKRMLETNPMTKPCLKRYLSNHVRSAPKVVPKDDWEIAIQLPFENFQKAQARQVWSNTRSKLR